MNVPSFSELVSHYGPYLGLIIIIVISFMIMQYRWYMKVIRSKDAEIARMVKHEDELNKRILHFVDSKLGYKSQMDKKTG